MKKQDWRTADSKAAGRDQTDRNAAIEKPIAGKKPLDADTTSKKAGSTRQGEDLGSNKSSGRQN